MTTVEAIIASMFLSGTLHGYELRRRLKESGIAGWAGISDVKVYRALEKLKRNGVLDLRRVEQKGRPPRQEYTLTPLGRAKLDKKIKELADNADASDGELAAFIYLTALGDYSRDALLAALKSKLSAKIENYEKTEAKYIQEADGKAPLVSYLIFSLGQSSQRAVIQWLDRLIRLLEKGPSLGLHSTFKEEYKLQ
ncbi:MAG: hypothetical protein Kow0090_10720 [Myxococcota bacterium]